MTIHPDKLEAEQPSIAAATALAAAKVSEALLLILCASPIAILALALAHRAVSQIFS
jgi:hypothetical protein